MYQVWMGGTIFWWNSTFVEKFIEASKKITVKASYQLVDFSYAFIASTWNVFLKFSEKNVQIVFEKYPLMLRYVACSTPQYTTMINFFVNSDKKLFLIIIYT